MDSINQSVVTPRKTKLARTFAKFVHIRAVINDTDKQLNQNHHFREEIERLKNKASLDAFIAKAFATLSSVKAAYSELQYAQSPYDPEQIQSADRMIVSELQRLSELKQSFLKNYIDDPCSESTILLAEIQEQKNLMKTYDVTKKNLISQSRSKDSEIVSLKEKLDKVERENKLIERRLNSSGPSRSRPEYNLHEFSKLTSNDFVTFLKHAMKSVRSFVKLMISEMEFAKWDIDAAARSIQPDAAHVYWKEAHRCFAFESFVCGKMFDGFNHPSFSIAAGDDQSTSIKQEQQQMYLFDGLMELKAREYITWKPDSIFAKFCWSKYLQLVHPKMESSLFGNLNQRNCVSAGKFPDTVFFESFAEVAKRVWVLHCLGFSFDPSGVSIFRVRNRSRFSEVFMESVNEEEAFMSPEVAFTVVPGFKLGESVVQCQVYLS